MCNLHLENTCASDRHVLMNYEKHPVKQGGSARKTFQSLKKENCLKIKYFWWLTSLQRKNKKTEYYGIFDTGWRHLD